MTKATDADLKRRHDAIYQAGAAAEKPEAVFDGRQLGSMETCTFYDGYASTHPDFSNPYRQRLSR